MKIKQWIGLILVGLSFSLSSMATERHIFLVRHAEKQADSSKDPALTQQGEIRADNIANQLTDKGIIAIYSSDYKRTQQTAAPLAKRLNLNVIIYDPRELSAFAEMIKSQSGNILIVGHSNTTPHLSQLLGGNSFGKIKDNEYDRLYQLVVDGDEVKTNLWHSIAKP